MWKIFSYLDLTYLGPCLCPFERYLLDFRYNTYTEPSTDQPYSRDLNRVYKSVHFSSFHLRVCPLLRTSRSLADNLPVLPPHLAHRRNISHRWISKFSTFYVHRCWLSLQHWLRTTFFKAYFWVKVRKHFFCRNDKNILMTISLYYF